MPSKPQIKKIRSTQIELLRRQPKSYGGELMKTREGRATARPLAIKSTMHLVLRSSKAKEAWSFKKPKNEAAIKKIAHKFAQKYGVRIFSLANVGNHLHFHIRLTNRHTYRPFIRAITAAIAMAVTGASRWNPLKTSPKDKFWDYRPFTRVVESLRALLNLRDYIAINKLEGYGYYRRQARFMIAMRAVNRESFLL